MCVQGNVYMLVACLFFGMRHLFAAAALRTLENA